MQYFYYIICLWSFGIGLLSALKKIPPNNWVGVRTPKTMSDPEIWYKVNQSFGVGFAIFSAIAFFGIFFIYRLDVESAKQLVYSSIMLVICLLIPVIFALR